MLTSYKYISTDIVIASPHDLRETAVFDSPDTSSIWEAAARKNGRIAAINYNIIQTVKEENAELRKVIDKWELAYTVQKANSLARKVQVDLFIKEHPDSPLLLDTGKRFEDGDIKTVVRLVYEEEFDASFSKMLPSVNPKTMRVD